MILERRYFMESGMVGKILGFIIAVVIIFLL